MHTFIHEIRGIRSEINFIFIDTAMHPATGIIRVMKVTILSMLSGSFDPYWKEVERGVNAARAHFDVEVEYLVPPAGANSEKSISEWQLNAASKIASDKDAAAVGAAVLNYSRAPEIIRRITGAGIPCVTFDTDAPQSERAFFVGTNSRAAGSTCAYVMSKLIQFKGKVAVDAPSLNVFSCIERIAGFREIMTRYANIHIERDVCGDENEASMRAVARATAALPELSGVFCASGTTAKINADALKSAGLAGKVSLVCVDADDDILALIRAGVIQMTIAQRPYSMGYRLMDYLYQIANRGLDTVLRGIPQNHIVDTGIHQVTQANIDNYIENAKRLQN